MVKIRTIKDLRNHQIKEREKKKRGERERNHQVCKTETIR